MICHNMVPPDDFKNDAITPPTVLHASWYLTIMLLFSGALWLQSCPDGRLVLQESCLQSWSASWQVSWVNMLCYSVSIFQLCKQHCSTSSITKSTILLPPGSTEDWLAMCLSSLHITTRLLGCLTVSCFNVKHGCGTFVMLELDEELPFHGFLLMAVYSYEPLSISFHKTLDILCTEWETMADNVLDSTLHLLTANGVKTWF